MARLFRFEALGFRASYGPIGSFTEETVGDTHAEEEMLTDEESVLD